MWTANMEELVILIRPMKTRASNTSLPTNILNVCLKLKINQKQLKQCVSLEPRIEGNKTTVKNCANE
jgi:hypothetical protein